CGGVSTSVSGATALLVYEAQYTFRSVAGAGPISRMPTVIWQTLIRVSSAEVGVRRCAGIGMSSKVMSGTVSEPAGQPPRPGLKRVPVSVIREYSVTLPRGA